MNILQKFVVCAIACTSSLCIAQPWVARPEDFTPYALTGYVTYQGDIYRITQHEDMPSSSTQWLRDNGQATTPTVADLRVVTKLSIDTEQLPSGAYKRKTYMQFLTSDGSVENTATMLEHMQTSRSINAVPYK
jgi:hypothetical protein